MNAKIRKLAHRLRADQRGLTTVEYTILLCLIAALSVPLWKTFGDNIHGYLNTSTKTIDKNVKKAASH